MIKSIKSLSLVISSCFNLSLNIAAICVRIIISLRTKSVKCRSNVGDQLLITNVATMLGNNWLNLIPTVEKVIFR